SELVLDAKQDHGMSQRIPTDDVARGGSAADLSRRAIEVVADHVTQTEQYLGSFQSHENPPSRYRSRFFFRSSLPLVVLIIRLSRKSLTSVGRRPTPAS